MYSNTTTHYGLPQYEANDVPSILGDVNGAYQTIDTTMYDIADAASEATSKSTQASTDATTAINNASAAQADATQALADAASAQGDATLALTTANTANTNASQAISDAASALSTAQAASSAAGSAATTAANALSTATQAGTDASTALTTAQSASTAASGAQTDATSALTLLGNTTLPTTAQTVTGAIDEIATEIGTTPLTTTAQTLTGAIEEVKGMIGSGESVEVTGDGTKTYATLLGELVDLVDFTKVTNQAMLEVKGLFSTANLNMQVGYYYDVDKVLSCSRTTAGASTVETDTMEIRANGSYYHSSTSSNSSTFTNKSTDILPNGAKLILHY